MKRLVEVCCIAMAVLCSVVAVADTETVNGTTWTYTITDGQASVEGSSSTSGAIIIPPRLGGCAVTSIGYRAFYYCSGLTSVTLPDSVTSIGNDAFAYCSGLTSMTLPNGLVSIGSATCPARRMTAPMIKARVEAASLAVAVPT